MKDTYLPKTFFIETVLGCNLRCVECAVGAGMVQRKHGMMSYDEYLRIAEKIQPYCEYLYLHMWGEPMLNKDILPMIQHASEFTKVNISTNGQNMDVKMARDLIISGVTDLIVSIDGVTQEVYGAYRIGGQVEKALNALVMLQKLNEGLGQAVTIHPQFVVFEHNQHEMQDFDAFCRSIGLAPIFKAPYIREGSALKNTTNTDFIRPKAPSEQARLRAMRKCPDAYHTFTIQKSGDVVACCYDHNSLTTFGNIFEQDLLDIWNSPKYYQFRQDIRNGDIPRFCVDECLMF